MAKDMTLFDNKVQMPAHIADMFGEDESNIDTGASVPSLSIRGKIFRISMEGEEKMLTRYDNELEDDVPLNTLSVIVINQGPFGARVYYEGDYSPDSNEGPSCFSLDGKHPDAKAREPQANSCAACPHAVKGSKISNSGTATTACQLQRRLAVVPANKPDFTALLLRLAPTSAWDPETKNSDAGWFGWRQYLDFLNARGVRHTAQVVTKLRFDSDVEHPKLLFRPDRFLTEDEASVVAERLNSDEVMSLLHPDPEAEPPKVIEQKPGGKIMGDGDDDEPEEKPKRSRKKSEPEPEEKPKRSRKKSEPESESEDGDGSWGDEPEEKPKRSSKKSEPEPEEKPKRRAAPASSKAQDTDDGDVDEDEKPKRRATNKAADAPAAGGGIDALLDDWDA